MGRVLPANSELIPKQAKIVFRRQIFDVYQWQQNSTIIQSLLLKC